MSDKIFRIKKYTILEKFEDSNYASIYKIIDQDHELRILKISRTSIRDNNDLIAREFRILSQFQHPHIVPVFHFDTHSDGRSYFITDFIPGLPIHEVLTSFSEKYATAMLQCIQALSAFHQKGFIHCDLKPEHIIYDQQQGKTVLIDFGFASAVSDEPLHAGTFGYIAPEILKGLGIDQRSDLYSIGVIMYETLAGKRYTDRFEDIKNVPDEINTLVHRLTSEEPALRPTLPDVHKILLKYTPTTKITLPEYSVTLPHTAYVADAGLNTNLQRGGDSTKIVVGTTGAGKSRTLQELKYQYLLADKTVVFHKATDPFTFPECLAQITGIDLSEIHEHDDKFQIFDMINAALHHTMKNKKLVILIDDIHEFSDYEMELFRYLGYGAEDTDMELIGSSMPDTRVTHLGFTQLQITPFSVAQTKDLLKKTFFKIDIIGTSVTEFASWLHSQSGGNPLFIREILKMLHDNAILYFSNNRWVVESKKMEKIRVPESI
jgi:serine/threonine protein kinase